MGIKFGMNDETILTGYSDSDFAGDIKSSKSTTGYAIFLYGVIFHWKTQLQRHVTLSSTEAEIIALCSLVKEMTWIRRMLIELDIMKDEIATIYCDNQSALKIAQSDRISPRTRHLRAQEDFIREQLKENEIELIHVSSNDQLADILTKCMQTNLFTSNRDKLLYNNL